MKITCPHCKTNLTVPDKYTGRKIRCPNCKNTFIAKAEKIVVPSDNFAVPQKKNHDKIIIKLSA